MLQSTRQSKPISLFIRVINLKESSPNLFKSPLPGEYLGEASLYYFFCIQLNGCGNEWLQSKSPISSILPSRGKKPPSSCYPNRTYQMPDCRHFRGAMNLSFLAIQISALP